MASTTIISCICSALHELEVFTAMGYRDDLSLGLMFVKTFVLCGKKLSNDPSFKHFLVKIEENLSKGLANESPVEECFAVSPSLGYEMVKWYVIMIDSRCTFLLTNEILEIITSILEALVTAPERFEPLTVQMRFLKSLIQFVTKGSTEGRNDLLAHSETIAINISYELLRVFFGSSDECSSDENSSGSEEMLSGLSTWLQMIKPIDPLVCVIYTQSLTGLKLSEQYLDDDALLAAFNFLDSLLFNLPEILEQDTHHIVSMKAQLQELSEKLISLKCILKDKPAVNFNVEIRVEIADVVTDVGILICSLCQPELDVNFFEHLLDKFKKVMLKITDGDPKPMFNFPKTSSYGFVDCILEKLMEFSTSETESNAKSHFQSIHVELASVSSSLGEFVELRDEQKHFQTIWDRLLKVAYKVESAIDYQVIEPLSHSFLTTFESIKEDIGGIKADVLKLEVKKDPSRTYGHLPSQTTPSASNEVVGFQDEERAILDRMRGGSKHLRIIAIVGMPGIGKTSLATKVYNHSSLSCHFSAQAWCPISQTLDKKKVLFDLLKQIFSDVSFEMDVDDLANKLRRSLKGKRYLIFLDDVWNSEAWNNLKDSFPDDTKGSRIILTSRSLDVAPRKMLDQDPLVLNPLSETDSWNLMYSRLFPRQPYVLPLALHALGMQIVARCGGLPLAITIVTGVLAIREHEDWETILSSFSIISSEENCRYTLEFSYRHLPDYLRPCFLYFGVFGEDEEVRVTRLLRLWIAEGFVRKSVTSSLEEVVEGYLNMLINRSLIMGAERRSNGGVKTCRIHDLLRDFCLEKAKDEHFFHFVEGCDELFSFNEPHNIRRLLIDSDPEDLRESRIYCPLARSLLWRSSSTDADSVRYFESTSNMLRFFKLLKVLDLEHVNISGVFPGAIEQLALLAFLAIRGDFTIPSWLGNLSNLETLIFSFCEAKLSLPENLWSMQKLKYLCIQSFDQWPQGVGVLPINNLVDSAILYELDRITGIVINLCSMEKELRKFPNVRKLKCFLSHNINEGEYVDKVVFPEFSSRLESLDMCAHPKQRLEVRFEFASLTNLKKLKLSKLHLYWEVFFVVGNQLPSLEVMKLHSLRFKDEEEFTWEMKSGEFSKLRSLHIHSVPIRRWIGSDDHEFECFQKLVLGNCHRLKELPSCLESIETLEMIEAYDCSGSVERLVLKIGEEQENWGNSGLKIRAHKTQK